LGSLLATELVHLPDKPAGVHLRATWASQVVLGPLSKTEEEVITEELVVAIKDAIEAPGAASWMQRYEVVDDIRVRHPKKRGKKRPRVDIEITNMRPGRRPRFHFEAKRLGKGHAVGQYVGRTG
jgi:hypothetical protein